MCCLALARLLAALFGLSRAESPVLQAECGATAPCGLELTDAPSHAPACAPPPTAIPAFCSGNVKWTNPRTEAKKRKRAAAEAAESGAPLNDDGEDGLEQAYERRTAPPPEPQKIRKGKEKRTMNTVDEGDEDEQVRLVRQTRVQAPPIYPVIPTPTRILLCSN